MVINASGILDASTAAFLPNLRDGEALLVGADSIMPLPVKMDPRKKKPRLQENVEDTWLTKV